MTSSDDAKATSDDEPAAADDPALADSSPDLDVDRGEVSDEDLDTLEQAVDTLDFATRQATPERLQRLDSLLARLTDIRAQVGAKVRRHQPAHEPLSAEDRARAERLIDDGVAAGERRRLEEAMRKLEEAVELDPEGLDALFNLGVVYGLMAHMNMAKAEFYDSYVRDEVYVEKAQIQYDRVLEVEPEHLGALNNLATLCSIRDERDLARKYLERMVDVTPETDEQKKLVEGAKLQLKEL